MGNRWAFSSKGNNINDLPQNMTAAQFREMIAGPGAVKATIHKYVH